MADRGWKAMHSSSHLLTEKWQAEDYRNHKQRIAEMQPMTDTSEPMAWRLRALRSVSPKAAWFRQVKATEIMRENQRLVESITRISNADHTLENSPQGGPVHGRQLFRSAFNVAGPGFRLGPNQVPVLDTSMPHSPGTLRGKAERVAADYIAENNISMYKRLMEASSRVSPDELDNKLRELEAFAAPHNAFDHTLRHYRPPGSLQHMPHLTKSIDGLALTSLGARAAGTRAHAATTHLTTSLWSDEAGVFDLKGMSAASATPPQTLKPYMSGPGRVVPSRARPVTAPVGDEGDEEEGEAEAEQLLQQQGVQEESSGHLPPLAGAGHQQGPHPRTAWVVEDSKSSIYGLSGERASTSPAKARAGKGKGTKGRFSRLPAHAYMKGTNAQPGVPGSTVTTLDLVSRPLPDGSALGQEGSQAAALGEEGSLVEVYGTSLPETGEHFSLKPLRSAWGRTSGPHPTAPGDVPAGLDQGSDSAPSTPLARLAAERGVNLAELLRSASPPPSAPAGARSMGWLNGAATMPPLTSISAGSHTGRLSGHNTERWLHTIPVHPAKGRLPPATATSTARRAPAVAGSHGEGPGSDEGSGDGRISPSLLKPLALHSSPQKQRHSAAAHTSPTRVIALHKPDEQSHQQQQGGSSNSYGPRSRAGPRAPAAALAARSLEDSDLEAAFHHEDLPVDEGYVEPREGHEAPKSQAGHRKHPPHKHPAPAPASQQQHPQAAATKQSAAPQQEVMRRKPQQAPVLPGPAVDQEDSAETADTYDASDNQFEAEGGQVEQQPEADASYGSAEAELVPVEEEEGPDSWAKAPAEAQRVSDGADEVAEEGIVEEGLESGDRPTAEVAELGAEPQPQTSAEEKPMPEAEAEAGDRPTEERYTWATEDQEGADQAQQAPTPQDAPAAAAQPLDDDLQQGEQQPPEPADGAWAEAAPDEQVADAPAMTADPENLQQGEEQEGEQEAAAEQGPGSQQQPAASADEGAGEAEQEEEQGEEEEGGEQVDVESEFSTMVQPGRYVDADDEDRYTVDLGFSADGRDPLLSEAGNQQQVHGSTAAADGSATAGAARPEAEPGVVDGTGNQASAEGAAEDGAGDTAEPPAEGDSDEGQQQEAGMAEGAVELDSGAEQPDSQLVVGDQQEEEGRQSGAAGYDGDAVGQERSPRPDLSGDQEAGLQQSPTVEGGDAVAAGHEQRDGETFGDEEPTAELQPGSAEDGASLDQLGGVEAGGAEGAALDAPMENTAQYGDVSGDAPDQQAGAEPEHVVGEEGVAPPEQQVEGQLPPSDDSSDPSQQQASTAADGASTAEHQALLSPSALPPNLQPSPAPERTASTASAVLPLLDSRASVGSGASGASVRGRRRRASWVDMEHLQAPPGPHVDPDMAMPVHLIAAAHADPTLSRHSSGEAPPGLSPSQGSGGASRLGMVRSDSLGRAVPSGLGFLPDQLAAQQAIVMRKKERTRSRLQMDSRTTPTGTLSPQGSGVPFPPASGLGAPGFPPGPGFPSGMPMDAAMLTAIYEEAAAGEGGGMRGGDITMSRRSRGSHLHMDPADEEGASQGGGSQAQLQSVPMLQDHAAAVNGDGDLGVAGDSTGAALPGSAAGSGRKGRGRRTSWIDLEQPTPDSGATYNLMAAANTDALLGGRLAAVGPTNAAQVQEQIAAQHALMSRKKERKKSRLQLGSFATDQIPGVDMGMGPDGSMQSAPWPADQQPPPGEQQQGYPDAVLTAADETSPALQQSGSMGPSGASRSRLGTAGGHSASRFAGSSFGVSGGSGVLMASVVDQESLNGMAQDPSTEQDGAQQPDSDLVAGGGEDPVQGLAPEQQQQEDVPAQDLHEQQQEEQQGDAADVAELSGAKADAGEPAGQAGVPADEAPQEVSDGDVSTAGARDMASPYRSAQGAEGQDAGDQQAHTAAQDSQVMPNAQQQEQGASGDIDGAGSPSDATPEVQGMEQQQQQEATAEQEQVLVEGGSAAQDAPPEAEAGTAKQESPRQPLEAEQSGLTSGTAGQATTTFDSQQQQGTEGTEEDPDSTEQRELLGGDVLGIGDTTPRAVQEEHSMAHLDSQQLSGFEDILGETSAEQTPHAELTPRSDAAVGAYRPAAVKGAGGGAAAQRYGPAVLEQSGVEAEMDPPSHNASSQALSGFEDALEDGRFIDEH